MAIATEAVQLFKLATPPLDERSKYLRKLVVRALAGGERGHVGSSMSLIEIMRVLYDDILEFRPKEPKWADRDRMILSKGHGCLALYAILADKGFIPAETLDTFCKRDSILGGHPEAGLKDLGNSVIGSSYDLQVWKGLAAAGADTTLNGRSQATIDAAVKKLAAEVQGAKVRGIAADVATADGSKALVAALPEVDILINNAGIYGGKDFFEISDEDWSHIFEVNVMSGVRMARAYMPGMLKRNWGRIVFISSESALNIPT